MTATSIVHVLLQAAFRGLVDLVRLCYLRAQSAGFPPDLHIAQHPLLDRLVPLMVLSELDHSEFRYFGEQVFPLAERWLFTQLRHYPHDEHEDAWTDSDRALGLIPRSYFAMLGKLD